MKKYLLLFLVLGLVFQACKKEEIIKNEGIPSTVVSEAVVFDMKDEPNLVKTKFGKRIDNPYLLRNMERARLSLYGNDASRNVLIATDLYVEFHPTSAEEFILLEELDIDLFDFPLGQDIDTLGDFYQDLADDEFPILYAVVPANFSFPSVAHTIIDELFLAESDKMLLVESFRQTEFYDEAIAVDARKKDVPEIVIGEGRSVPPVIVCDPGYEPKLFPIVPTPTSGYKYYWECVPIIPSDDPPSVNCVSGHSREPGGRITVEDTELSTHGDPSTFEPVKRVRVIMLTRFGWPYRTFTDDNGCWKIHKKLYGKGFMRVKFKNNRCRIRATHKNNLSVLWKWIVTHKARIGKINGPTFNNINVNFHMWNERGINSHLNWGAATINNSVHEFHEYASAQGIATPEKLDIYATRNRRDGYSLMHSQHVPANAAAIAAAGVTGIFAAPLAPIVGIVTWGSLMAYLPEVMIGIDFQHSDILKSLAYHEIAHSSHFENAGQDFWNSLVSTEILLNGHGSATSTNAGIVSVSESWAEHIGQSFNHLTYGGATSLGISWATNLEATRNEEPNHIPIGIYNDLIDIGTEPTSFDDFGGGSGVVTDGVSGFTNAQMFSVLTPTTTNMTIFRTTLISVHLGATTNTVASVNALFTSY